MRYCGFRLATSGSRANNTPRLIPNPPKCRPIAPKRPIFNCFHPMGLQFGGNTTSNRDLSTSPRGKWRHLRRDPAGSRLFAPCIDSPPGPATPRTDDANQADHTDEARRHAPSIANLRSKRRPLRPKHPFLDASGRGGLHVEHNTDNPPHNPAAQRGGFTTIEPP